MFQPNEYEFAIWAFGVSVLQGLAPKRRPLIGTKKAGEKAFAFGFFIICVFRPLIFSVLNSLTELETVLNYSMTPPKRGLHSVTAPLLLLQAISLR